MRPVRKGRLSLSNTLVAGSPPWSATESDVEAFIARYGQQYDASRDDYAVDTPFSMPVKAGKNTVVYNAHSYHTKVPPLGIVPYLEHYTRPSDLVLDPFCGSGMTGVACMMTGRRAILNDLSPAATHIAYNYCTPVDARALEVEWRRICASVADEFAYLYGTRCDRCGGEATINYTIWSDIYGCERCGSDLLLWDVAVVRDRTADGYDPPLSPIAPVEAWTPPLVSTEIPTAGAVCDEFACPHCRSVWRKTQLKRRRSDPVLTSYECLHCKPIRGQHPVTDDERALVQRIASESVPYWYPTLPFDETHEMWRGGHRDAGIARVCDFWTPRNLRALARLWHEAGLIRDNRLQRAVFFIITSAMIRFSRKSEFRVSGGSGNVANLHVPSFVRENNPASVLARKWPDVLQYFEQMSFNAGSDSPVLTTVHAGQDLGIPNDSIDYVFTDPPFGSNIFYADCSLLWEAWLGYCTDDRYEAVWNKSRKPQQGGKSLADYARLMTEAFREMYRVLKPGRWASVVFHNSDDRVWNAIRDAAADAGFSIENAVYFDKEQRSFKGVKGEKGEERVSNFDIVLNLRKAPIAIPHIRTDGQATDLPFDTESRIVSLIEEHLRDLTAGRGEMTTSETEQRTTQFIHSLVIRTLVPAGESLQGVSYAAIETILRALFRQVDGRWHLPGEEVRSALMQPRLMPEVHSEVTAIEWLRRELAGGSKLEGDLIDAFRLVAVKAHLSKSVRELLEENFTFDRRRGRWRIPTLAEAERQMDVTRTALRARVRRYLDAPGIVPGTALAEWLHECYQRELFEEAHALFSHILPDSLSGEDYAALRKLDRVARLRVAEEPRQLGLPES